jgi:hypothetical protein
MNRFRRIMVLRAKHVASYIVMVRLACVSIALK